MISALSLSVLFCVGYIPEALPSVWSGSVQILAVLDRLAGTSGCQGNQGWSSATDRGGKPT